MDPGISDNSSDTNCFTGLYKSPNRSASGSDCNSGVVSFRGRLRKKFFSKRSTTPSSRISLSGDRSIPPTNNNERSASCQRVEDINALEISSSVSDSNISSKHPRRNYLCSDSLYVNNGFPLNSQSMPSVSAAAVASNSVQIPSSPSIRRTKFKLISSSEVQVCRLKHKKTVLNKILSSKLLRRWETHHVFLNDSCISSKSGTGYLEEPLNYSCVEDVYAICGWDNSHKYCINVVIPDGSIVLQMSNVYLRDQWLCSIDWMRNIFKFRNTMTNATRPEVLLREIKSLVEFSQSSCIADERVNDVPMRMISNLLTKCQSDLTCEMTEEILSSVAPLLEDQPPSQELCDLFSTHCSKNPKSRVIHEIYGPVVHRSLKHNVDFGKYPHMRKFLQDYIQTLSAQNDGIGVVRDFVKSAHGTSSSCPHPRILPNLVSVCLAAVFSIFEDYNKHQKSTQSSTDENEDVKLIDEKEITLELLENRQQTLEEQLLCYLAVFDTISEYDDWRPGLAQLLQPVPFPEEALSMDLFTRSLMPSLERIGTDSRCDVHQMVLAVREGKNGWFQFYCPSNAACTDEGALWCQMLSTLLHCCCRRKGFLNQILPTPLLEPCLLLALRGQEIAQQILCLMLEWEMLSSHPVREVQAVTTLHSTTTGRKHYSDLCQRQIHLRELQQKGGPRKLTLPSRSTDSDLSKLLSCGSFGNLECLSLAFTQVTSACAEQLIKLPTLRYINLWSTQFGDPGLQLISEHLPKLQVLNLCETPVTDKGLMCLVALKNLRKLNMNSTHLSAHTFQKLKEMLPSLQECDVRYTDAW